MMKHPICDLHIHSISSGHAFNTIDEIIEYSETKGYDLIGISDHGPDMEGTPHTGYFEMLCRLPNKSGRLTILYGCEANILDTKGTIDIPDRIVPKLDYIIAGLHKRTSYNGNSIVDNTKSIVSAIYSGKVDIISHPISLNFLADPKSIVKAASEEQIILECNKSILKEAAIHHNNEVIQLTTDLLNYAFDAGVAVLFGSDAHHVSEMGISDDEFAAFQKIYGFSMSKMLNEDLSLLNTLLQKRKQLRSSIYHEK